MHTFTFSVPNALVEYFTDGMADGATAITARVDEHAAAQQIIAYFDVPPDVAELTARLAILAEMQGVPSPAAELKLLPKTDWLAEVYRGLHPLQLGRFYVYGSHSHEQPPAGTIPIMVDAATAFGSGHHATTAACLIALSDVSQKIRPDRMLDLGCGSGILAIGMAKLFRKKLFAMDIDPEAVRVTLANAKLNQCSQFITAATGGTDHAAFRRHAPYDLIMANILARPLTLMAAQITNALAPNATLILSGLLTSQEKLVANAYAPHGMRMVGAVRRDPASPRLRRASTPESAEALAKAEGWSAIVMKKVDWRTG